MIDELAAAGIRLRSHSIGTHRTTCPACSHKRKKKHDPCLSVTIDDDGATWNCHHCDFRGGFKSGQRDNVVTFRRPKAPPVRPTLPERVPVAGKALEFFTKRGITKATLDRHGIFTATVWMPRFERPVEAIGFPYKRNGELVNVKWRAPGKTFRQEKNAEKVWYGLDDCIGQDAVVIVEGEMDKLALSEIGINNVMSPPDGAPQHVQADVPDPEQDAKFEYVHNCKAETDHFKFIYLAVDQDGPGSALAEELARRLGKVRCLKVTWPSDCKDANDVLLKHGAKAIREALDAAEPFPITGLTTFGAHWHLVEDYYQHGLERGASTGWRSLDDLLRVRPGRLTIVTGIPGSGKSEWLDALAVNLAEREGWRFSVCSRENELEEHARKLAEKYLRMPFFNARYSVGRARMGTGDLQRAREWLDDRFSLIRMENGDMPRIDWVVGRAREAVERYGIRGLILDPYNEFDHQRPPSMTETEYISRMLSQIKSFCHSNGVHCFFVAHPQKLYGWTERQVPTGYDISGGAHWFNKVDIGITIHRYRKEPEKPVEVHVWKRRSKLDGELGMAQLAYDNVTGTYSDLGDGAAPERSEPEPVETREPRDAGPAPIAQDDDKGPWWDA